MIPAASEQKQRHGSEKQQTFAQQADWSIDFMPASLLSDSPTPGETEWQIWSLGNTQRFDIFRK